MVKRNKPATRSPSEKPMPGKTCSECGDHAAVYLESDGRCSDCHRRSDDHRLEDGKEAFSESLEIMDGTAGKWTQRFISVFRLLQDAGIALEDYELMPAGMADGVLERQLLEEVNKSRALCGEVVLRMLSHAAR